MRKKAVVFGAGGQAGIYLCNLLRQKDYEVWGMGREQCNFLDRLAVINMYEVFKDLQPDEVYNLAGKNFVPGSWEEPEEYMQVNGYVVLDILQSLQKFAPKARFLLAGSAEVFEKGSWFQDEATNRLPNSPYGLSKLLGMEYVRLWRTRGLYACTAIFFNMESPWRVKTYFAEKIASEVVRMRREITTTGEIREPLRLGRLDARRDWGLTEEYMEAAWRMLQLEEPSDFCIGTGERNTCLAYVKEALEQVSLGDRFDECVVYDKTEGSRDCLRAITDKAEKRLGWKAKSKMKEVIKKLVDAELADETRSTGDQLGREVCSS